MQSADPYDRDIIVVDNASVDDSRAFITEHYPAVLWIQNASNAGYARAVNQGVEASRGDMLFLLNNDVVLMEDTVAGLVGCLLKHPAAAAAAPVLVYPDGRLQISCRRFPTPAAILLEKLRIMKFGPFRKLKPTADEHLRGGKILQPMMSALMVRRE
ncbi:MAG: glycosyltransferase [Comamonadaceae bacterium]|nr:glycosyltransferase [Comamonadaceae bacterium]